MHVRICMYSYMFDSVNQLSLCINVYTITLDAQGVFEDVQSAFIKYAIEVVAWEEVPSAVQKLAHKQGKDPLPDGELCFCLQTI